ncbi:MAG: PE-PPE domain-containing protein [Mycobacterium sp.]
MSYVLTAPDALAAAATDVNGIASALSEANAAAAGRTSGLLAAADDEVSQAIAELFGAYGQEYQEVLQQASAFHNEFTQTLAAASTAYSQAEAANVTVLNAGVSNAAAVINAPMRSLLGTAGTGGPALSAATTALIMGGTNNPLPDPEYVTDIYNKYVQPLFPGAIKQGLFTHEQFWPVTPDLGTLTMAQSVAQDVTLLNAEINHQLSLGNKVVASGYSLSSVVINNEINALMAAGSPHANDISFIMLANPNTPDGGLLSRFPGFYIPILDVPFNGATPPNSPYQTTIYTAQYDGIANAPQYPIHILSDINAVMGYFFVHGQYPDMTSAMIHNAVPLPTSPGYTGTTQYYMLMTQNLPLVQPIRNIPFAGPPLADLIQPQLRVLVDLGYSDYGAGHSYADVPTPAGLFTVPNPFAVGYYLIQGTLQAPYGAAVEIGVEAGLLGPQYFPDTYPWVPSISPGTNFYFGQPQVTALSTLAGEVGNVLHIIPPIFNGPPITY